MSFSERSKLAHTIAVRAVKQMGQTVALQVCFNESLDKEDFIRGMIEKAKDIKKTMVTRKWSKHSVYFLQAKLYFKNLKFNRL